MGSRNMLIHPYRILMIWETSSYKDTKQKEDVNKFSTAVKASDWKLGDLLLMLLHLFMINP